MSKIKVDKPTKRAKFFKKAIFLVGFVFTFFVVIFTIPCENVDATGLSDEEIAEARERLDILLEKTEELYILLEYKFQRGELPSSANIPSGEPYIREYIAYGANNSKEEVKKLQSFLNTHMGEALLVDGFYGNNTFQAVKRFQLKYASEILHPWGINEPTGFVYLTTQRKINALQRPYQYFPMPTLVPYSKTVSYDTAVTPVSNDFTEDTEKEIDEEDETEYIEEELRDIEEELEELVTDKELPEEETEEERANVFLWIVVALSFIGFIVIISYLFVFNKRKNKKEELIQSTKTKETKMEKK